MAQAALASPSHRGNGGMMDPESSFMVGNFFFWHQHHKALKAKQSQENIPMFTACDVDFGCHYFRDSLLQFLRQIPLAREPQTLVRQTLRMSFFF